jgi:hypothetical protein
MTEEQQKELEIQLTCYMLEKHTQDECAGFIDGFKEALSLFAVSRRSEQLNCDHEWRVDTFDCYGFPAFKYCDKCCKKEAV